MRTRAPIDPTLNLLALIVHLVLGVLHALGFGHNAVRRNYKWAGFHLIASAADFYATYEHFREARSAAQRSAAQRSATQRTTTASTQGDPYADDPAPWFI
jgi:hypothetical protein